ncbi:MAG: 2-hydroxychromene-2-carboxylate isomerase [Hyphomicrobiaceae bacterium]|nr:MAG: 2-hydroxychromene-2-carboxylate isomerase [Hyphomicrobiaceae bacterium]
MAAKRGVIEFWYDFASTYSYLSAMRIEALAERAGVRVNWRPFLLGPIFQAQGWSTSPFNLYPAKGRYMVRDIERLAGERGLTFKLPGAFPARSLLPARVALALHEQERLPDYTRAVFLAEFSSGADIADRGTQQKLLAGLGLDATKCLSEAETPENKEKLRRQTLTAQNLGIFGAPSFIVGNQELFWGDDRLEQAIAWAKS